MLRPLPLLVVLLAVLAACGPDRGDPAPAAPPVARVGNAVLTEADLADALGGAGQGAPDSAAARRRAVERWVRAELLAQAARDAGLDRDPDVRRRLAEAERATLAGAAIDRLYDASSDEPTETELREVYAREHDEHVLDEPHVRLRHLRTGSRETAEAAAALLTEAGGAGDEVFPQAARLYADDPAGALALAAEMLPERALANLDPALPARVARLAPGGAAAVIAGADGSVFHVVQVVERARAGTVAPFSVVRDELAERLAFGRRRRQEAQYLRSLRAEAQAAGRLDIR